ncbi:MAG: hypothetical protein V4718_00560 [Pseudomonadota bacterium]
MTRHITILIKLLAIFSWMPTAGLAAVVAQLGPDSEFVNVTLLVVLVNLGFSTLAGATTLAIRINGQLLKNPEKPLPKPWLFCAAHMLGSWCAGSFFFMLGQHQHVGFWMCLGWVLLASFAGAKVLELAVERYLPMRPTLPTEERP